MRTETEIRAQLAKLKEEHADKTIVEQKHSSIIRDISDGRFTSALEEYIESVHAHDSLVWQIALLEWILGKDSMLFDLEEEED